MDLPILYSFRRCPYAMRARLALARSRQSCLHREVDLRSRPQELLRISPKGTVPVLQLADGRVIEESLEIMHWALARNDPGSWLPATPATREEVAGLIACCDGEFKHHLDRYKYASRHEDVDPVEQRELAAAFLKVLDRRLQGSSFLFGEQPTLADMALLPFVRQFALTDRSWFDGEGWDCLRAWLDDFLASELFAGIMTKFDPWKPESEPFVVEWGS